MSQFLPQPYLALLLSATLTLSACGGGNSAAGPAPNTGNIPNLATRPVTQAAEVKKVRLAGEIFNSLSLKPIEKAEILLQVVEVSAPQPPSPPPGETSSVPTPPPGQPNNQPPPTSDPLSPNQPPPGGDLQPGDTQPTVPPLPPGSNPALPGPGDAFPDMAPPPGDEQFPPVMPDGGDGLPAPLPGGAALPFVPANYALTFPGEAIWSASGASFQLAQNTSNVPANPGASPAASKETPNNFKTDTNNRGKFFINDVPDGKYVLTVTAPGYRALTLTDINPNQLNVPLTPLEMNETVDVVGMVMSPSDLPIQDARVSPSFPLGEAVGIPATSNDMGEFKLLSVPHGRHSLLAFTVDDQEQIKQMGILRDVLLSTKNMKVQSKAMEASDKNQPKPTASPDAAKRQELEKSVEKMLIEEDAEPIQPGADTPEVSEDNSDLPADEPAISPQTDPAVEPESLPDTAETITENEELAKPERSFNLLDRVKELITGDSAEETSAEKIYPVISLRSVLNNVELAGNVKVPENFTLKQVEVYLSLTDKDEKKTPEEIYLFSRPLQAAGSKTDTEKAKPPSKPSGSASPPAAEATKGTADSQRFRLRLPDLDKNQAYHLQFTAVNENGQISYHHLYNLKESDEDLSVSFLPGTELIELEGEDVNAIPPVPGMGWSAVAGAELYHVTLAAGTGLNQQIIWEAWTKETQLKYPLSTREQRLKEQQTYTLSVEAIKGLRPALNSSQEKYALPSYRAIWTDLSRVTHPPFEVVE